MHLEDAFLCVSLDVDAVVGSSAEWCRHAIAGGADLVMLHPGSGDYSMLQPVADICRDDDAMLVLSGDPDAGTFLGADGVHLPGVDANIGEARAVMGLCCLVGVSVGSIDEARLALQIGADYLLYTGEDLSVLPVLRSIATVPMYVSDGGDFERAKDVIDAGVFRLSVNGSGIAVGDVTESIAEFSRLLGRCI